MRGRDFEVNGGEEWVYDCSNNIRNENQTGCMVNVYILKGRMETQF